MKIRNEILFTVKKFDILRSMYGHLAVLGAEIDELSGSSFSEFVSDYTKRCKKMAEERWPNDGRFPGAVWPGVENGCLVHTTCTGNTTFTLSEQGGLVVHCNHEIGDAVILLADVIEAPGNHASRVSDFELARAHYHSVRLFGQVLECMPKKRDSIEFEFFELMLKGKLEASEHFGFDAYKLFLSGLTPDKKKVYEDGSVYRYYSEPHTALIFK